MPGFDRVVFAKQVASKLASIADMCDTKLVCVFDDEKLRTYRASDVEIRGKHFTSDMRDPKTRLYPLTLYRKKKEEKEGEKLHQSSGFHPKAGLAPCEI